jgi:hypothetical protein
MFGKWEYMACKSFESEGPVRGDAAARDWSWGKFCGYSVFPQFTARVDLGSKTHGQLDQSQADKLGVVAEVGFEQILLKNSNFGLDHNLEDRWQPQWKFP